MISPPRSGLPLLFGSALSNEGSPVFGVDLRDLLFSIDVRLIQAVDPAAAHVVAAGAELALRPTSAPQRLSDDLFPFLPGRILDQDGSHGFLLFTPFCIPLS